ncbi:MAG: Minf_1886 family protein [Planctomycetota bacterium]
MTSTDMSQAMRRLAEIARKDGRYSVDAYIFLQQSLAYAQFELGMGRPRPFGMEDDDDPDEPPPEAHLTGQQLCEAIRQFAAELYGLMAKVVLNSWGVKTTGDFGEIVYKLIELGEMTKSETDSREDFDDIYDFQEAFQRDYEITILEPDDSE